MARVLIAEVHPEIERLFARVVDRAGHVSVLLNGAGSEPPEFDILLFEQALPGVVELARAVRAVRPDLPMVCVSIYPPTPEVTALGPVAFLIKPFPLEELEEALRRATASLEAAAAACRAA